MNDMKFLIFGTPNCPHSKALAKTVKACYPLIPTKMINIYKKPELALKYDIKAFPTTVAVFDDGEVSKIIGNVNREALIDFWLMEKLLD